MQGPSAPKLDGGERFPAENRLEMGLPAAATSLPVQAKAREEELAGLPMAIPPSTMVMTLVPPPCRYVVSTLELPASAL